MTNKKIQNKFSLEVNIKFQAKNYRIKIYDKKTLILIIILVAVKLASLYYQNGP